MDTSNSPRTAAPAATIFEVLEHGLVAASDHGRGLIVTVNGMHMTAWRAVDDGWLEVGTRPLAYRDRGMGALSLLDAVDLADAYVYGMGGGAVL